MKIKFLFFLLLLTGCTDNTPKMHLLMNANIITVNPARPKAEALVISGSKIAYVGSNLDAQNFAGSSALLWDLQGKTIIPGFIDAHAHLQGLGNSLLNLDLSATKNWNEVVKIVERAAQNRVPGEWIIGRGWHQEKWSHKPDNSVDGFPTHFSVSHISPQNPVILKHASGHAVFINAKAMELAGINMTTPNPPGGEILRNDKEVATGILLENATNLIEQVHQNYIKSLTPDQQKESNLRALDTAMDHCLQNGVTTFHDAGATYEILDLYRELADKNKLGIRIWAMISESEIITPDLLRKYKTIGFGDNFLTIRALKKYVDGALGSRGAWLLEPYADSPDLSGKNLTPLEKIEQSAQLAFSEGYQFCTHAIGDRGNREMLNIYETILTGQINHRWRIEHAQHLSQRDIPRFSALGIIASMQTVHCTSDGPWVPERIGDQRAKEGAYVWQTLLQSGVKLANGTDCPVERLSPIANYYAAVTRKLNNGEFFYPEQVLSREQALQSLTIWNAYAGFEEDIKGSIEVGKLADLVVLSQDILTVPEEDILKISVDYTIINGKIKYKR